MIEFKGRNGYARYDRHFVTMLHDDSVYVELYSKRQGDTAPVVITGPKGEVLTLLRDLVALVEVSEWQKNSD